MCFPPVIRPAWLLALRVSNEGSYQKSVFRRKVTVTHSDENLVVQMERRWDGSMPAMPGACSDTTYSIIPGLHCTRRPVL